MGATESRTPAPKPRRPYRCFLLRCRLQETTQHSSAGPLSSAERPDSGGGSEFAWRITVQEAGRDGARRCFASLKDVEAYLEAELTSCVRGMEENP